MLGFRTIAMVLSSLMIALFFGTLGMAGQTGQETFYQGSDGALCVPMGNFTIDPPADIKPLRASVNFPHTRHFIYNCKRCHHKWNGVQPVKTCRTSGCHEQATPTEKPLKDGSYTDTGMKYYKYAYHNQCRGCHQEIRLQKEEMAKSIQTVEHLPEAGPTGCIECHPK